MAKRFTDSDKWKDMTFLRKLPTEYKLLWLYMWDDCDHAGIWHVDLDTAFTKLGVKFSLEKIRGLFKEKVVEFENGTKLFIPDFIAFQYGQLNPANKVHRSVLKSLELFKSKGLVSPLDTAMDKDKDIVLVLNTKEVKEKIQKRKSAMQEDYLLQDSCIRVRGFSQEQFEFAIEDFLGTIASEPGALDRGQGEINTHFTNWSRAKEKTIKERKDLKPIKKQKTDADLW